MRMSPGAAPLLDDRTTMWFILNIARNRSKNFPEFTQWTPDSAETLRGCFEATDWNIFFDTCESDQDALTDTITSYTTSREDCIIPTKEVRIYPNGKPWIGKDLKQCLNEKNITFLQEIKQKVRELKKQLRSKVKTARLEYNAESHRPILGLHMQAPSVYRYNLNGRLIQDEGLSFETTSQSETNCRPTNKSKCDTR